MSEHIVSTRASIGEYRYRYLVVGCVAILLTLSAILVGYCTASLDIAWMRRTMLGFGLGSSYTTIVCGYHITLFRRRKTALTHPITPMGGVLSMVAAFFFFGASVLLGLGFLSGSIVGYFMLTGWERLAKKRVVVVRERLVRSELRVVDRDVRLVYLA